jgi:uncharacterized membrane protein YwaF
MILTAPLFGPKHLSGLFVIFIVTVLFLMFFKKQSISLKRINLTFFILFLLLELIKYWVGLVRNDYSFPINYLPLQLCSLPIYIYLLLQFNNKRLNEWLYPAAFAPVLLAGMLALLIPVNIIGNETTWAITEDNILPILSFAYHGLMILSSLVMISHKDYKFEKQGYKKAIVVVLILTVIAILFNSIFDTDFMLLNRGNGSPFGFLVEISKSLHAAFMIALGSLLIFLIHFFTHKLKCS